MKYKLPVLILFAVFGFMRGYSFYKKPLAATDPEIKRPVDVWVVRSVLDQKPRMLSIALHQKLWLAYNTQTAALYQAWNGIVKFDGSVYTGIHGVQPTSRGVDYLQEPDNNPWRIIKDNVTLTPTITYKGHTILNNRVTLQYELAYRGGKIIVRENPEAIDMPGEQVGFERVFTTSKLPPDIKVSLRMHLSSLAADASYVTNGKFKVYEKSRELLAANYYHATGGVLLLNNNAPTRFVATLRAKPPVAQTARKVLTDQEKIAGLIANTDCSTCHNKDVKTVGPSYLAIAQRYANTLKNQEMLVSKVISGGAGNWGSIPMTPHTEIAKQDLTRIISYILSLDEKEESKQITDNLMPQPAYPVTLKAVDTLNLTNGSNAGIAINAYRFSTKVINLPDIPSDLPPTFSGSINTLHLGRNDFGTLKNNFVIHATGALTLKKTTTAVLRIVSDGGSRLFIDDKLVISNDGAHNLRGMEAEIILKEGTHPFKVEYFPGTWGKSVSLQWIPYGAKTYSVMPPELFSYTSSDIKRTNPAIIPLSKVIIPGDTFPLESVHPSFTLSQARPEWFQPRVGGMDFLPDGRLAVCTWDSVGAVYVLDGAGGKNPDSIKVKRIAYGMAEPLGLKVVDDHIYIMQKQELTRLSDLNQDGIIDNYEAICNKWKASTNFHEFAFGLVYKDGYFYGALATAIDPGGASTKIQVPDRGKVIKISKANGSYSFVAKGLRVPNGIGIGTDNEIFVTDNQGDWLPSNKLLHLQQGDWYGSRAVDFEGTAKLKETPASVFLTEDEIAKSPSQPVKLNIGPYKNQMLFGDVTYGGIQRAFLEKINNNYQGAVFMFTQGLEAGVNRLVWGPDSALYVGGVGMKGGGWIQYGKLTYGLQKLTYNTKTAFEMLAVRARPNGIEIEFTEPLKAGAGTKPSDYTVKQWWFKPTAEYGGPKMDETALQINSIRLSADRKKAFLELPGVQAKHVVYVRLNYRTMKSASDESLWSTEAWYSMNSIPVK